MINPSPNSSSKRSYPPVSGGSVPPPPAPGFPAQPGYSGPAPGYPPSIPASGYPSAAPGYPPAAPAYPTSMAPPPPPMMGYPPGASPGGFVAGSNLHPGWGGSPSLSGPSPPASQSAAPPLPPPPHSPTSAAMTGGARRKLYPDQAKTAYETPAAYSSQPPPPVMGGGGVDLGYAQPGAAPGMLSPMDGMQKQFGQLNLSSNNVNKLVMLQGPPNISNFENPPPPIILPPGAMLVPSASAIPDASYKRATTNMVPTTPQLAKKSRLPLGMIITPYQTNETVPTVGEITRCRRCRTYINPYVSFVESGRRWKCNLCMVLNDVPTFFDYDYTTEKPTDRWQRAELTHAVVEYLAPSEYMVRPPQPPVYFFVIDVSFSAVQNGFMAVAATAIRQYLDRIPNRDGRSKIGVMTVDSALHFYALQAHATEPQMMVVSDLDDIFLPQPNDLLCNLLETRDKVESLLSKLPDMFQGTQTVGNALGPALQAAQKLISPMGGKIVVIQSSLPSLGVGALKPRESPALTPQDSFYKTFAVDCSRLQVSVDLFISSSQYADVATISCLSRFTGGHHYFYPGFAGARADDSEKLREEIGHFLSLETGLEAVLRIRATKGIRLSAFHGNFFLRSMDLLALPNVMPDHTYAVEYELEESLTTPTACFQTAVLHTSCHGERRIRVVTLALPTTSSMSDLYNSADQLAIVRLLASKAVERSLSAKLEDAREALAAKCAELLGVFRSEASGASNSAVLQIPENLSLFPLLMLSLLKNVAFRAQNTPSDLRSNAQGLINVMPAEFFQTYIHPRFYSLHNMSADVGKVVNGRHVLPVSLNLTSERLDRRGLFLLVDSHVALFWLGSDASPQMIEDLLGISGGYAAVRSGKQQLPVLNHPFNQAVHQLLAVLRESWRNSVFPSVYIVKEDGDPALRLWFLSYLIEDRTGDIWSYVQFLAYLRERVNTASY